MDIQRVVFEHAMLGATSWVAASVYGGAPAHGGVASTIYRAFLSPAHVGSATAGTSALADTVYAMSVYAEPFAVAARFLSLASVPVVIVGGSALIAHKIRTDPSWQSRAQKLGQGMDFSPHISG